MSILRNLARRKLRGKDDHDVTQITSPKKVVAMQKALEASDVPFGCLRRLPVHLRGMTASIYLLKKT